MENDAIITNKLRSEAELLLSQARSQSMEIQRALGALAGDPALQPRLADAAAQISNAISQLSLALSSPGAVLRQIDLAALAGIVNSGAARELLVQVSAQTKGSAALAGAVSTASANTRLEAQNLARDVFDRRIFAAYLRFASPEDEEAFRRREAEARAYIDAQLARRTPEGDLNAGGGMMGYMLDAHAHGAGDSPEFMRRWNALAEKTARQHAAMRAAGQSTEEYDRRIAAHVRAFLKHQGLPDTEIDKRLAGTANPLEAAAPLLDTGRAAHSAPSAQPLIRIAADVSKPHQASLSIDMSAMDAKLKAAGLLLPKAGTAGEGHGLGNAQPGAAASLGAER